jgi:hypothetical protein
MSDLVTVLFETWCDLYKCIVRGADTRELDAKYTVLWAQLTPEQRAELLAKQLATRP